MWCWTTTTRSVSISWPIWMGHGHPPRNSLLMERASLDLLGMRTGETAIVQLPNGTERQLRIAGTGP